MPRFRQTAWVATVAVLVAACAPATSRTAGGGATVPERAVPKNIVAITSGNPPGLDNRFIVTSNNANRVAVPLYASKLIISDTTEGTRAPQLAEAVPAIVPLSLALPRGGRGSR